MHQIESPTTFGYINKTRVKYVFGPSSFSEIWNSSLIKTFDQFSPSSFKMREFSPFNQILLSLSKAHFMIVFKLFTLFDTFLLQC